MTAAVPHHRKASRGVPAAGALDFPPPAGFTLLEVILAAAMLAVLFAIVGQLIVNMKRQTGLAERHALALRTTENAMEEVTALPWDKIDDRTVLALPLPDAVRQRWPDAEFSGSVTASSDPVEAKRILLNLSLAPESRIRPATLTTWIYRKPRE